MTIFHRLKVLAAMIFILSLPTQSICLKCYQCSSNSIQLIETAYPPKPYCVRPSALQHVDDIHGSHGLPFPVFRTTEYQLPVPHLDGKGCEQPALNEEAWMHGSLNISASMIDCDGGRCYVRHVFGPLPYAHPVGVIRGCELSARALQSGKWHWHPDGNRNEGGYFGSYYCSHEDYCNRQQTHTSDGNFRFPYLPIWSTPPLPPPIWTTTTSSPVTNGWSWTDKECVIDLGKTVEIRINGFTQTFITKSSIVSRFLPKRTENNHSGCPSSSTDYIPRLWSLYVRIDGIVYSFAPLITVDDPQ